MLAISTGFGVLANLALGKAYDRIGLPVVIVAVCVSAAFSPFVFLGGFWLVLLGMLLWGVAYATQDTLLKAIVVELLPEGKRNFAFGLYYAGYGVGWLAGSIVAGLLYENSRAALIAFSICHSAGVGAGIHTGGTAGTLALIGRSPILDALSPGILFEVVLRECSAPGDGGSRRPRTCNGLTSRIMSAPAQDR
jgi:MFS family permease